MCVISVMLKYLSFSYNALSVQVSHPNVSLLKGKSKDIIMEFSWHVKRGWTEVSYHRYLIEFVGRMNFDRYLLEGNVVTATPFLLFIPSTSLPIALLPFFVIIPFLLFFLFLLDISSFIFAVLEILKLLPEYCNRVI